VAEGKDGMDFRVNLRDDRRLMNRRIHKGMFYVLLLGVYAAFFSVESFYNFEGQPRSKEDLHYSTVKNTPPHSAVSCRFRLNKRFHPQAIPPCPIISPTTPGWRLTPLRLGSPGDHPLPDIAIFHYSLRGPPPAA
jgi:hypothetical protein